MLKLVKFVHLFFNVSLGAFFFQIPIEKTLYSFNLFFSSLNN